MGRRRGRRQSKNRRQQSSKQKQSSKPKNNNNNRKPKVKHMNVKDFHNSIGQVADETFGPTYGEHLRAENNH
jgi:hypothetical protein